MQVRLLVKNDKANVKKVVLRSNTVIGRSSDCNLRIASQEVSRRHCSITLADDSVRVRDLGSSNGTFLNGKQLAPNVEVLLPSGAELSIGNVKFYIQHDAPPVDGDSPSKTEIPEAAVAAAVVAQPVKSPTADEPEPEPEAAAPAAPAETDAEESAQAAESTAVSEPKEDVQDTISGSASDLETVNTKAADLKEQSQEFEAPDDAGDATASEETIAFDFSGGALPIDSDEDVEADEPATDIHTESTIQSEVPAEPEDAAETVSMHVDELGLEASEPEPEPEPEPPAEKKGFRKLFGLFGRRKQQPQEEESEPVTDETGEDPDATVHLSAGEMPDEEEDYSDSEETLYDPVAVADDSEEDEQHEDEEAIGFQPQEEEQPAEEADEVDENLQDFFRNLAQD